MEVKTDTNGKTIRYMTISGATFVHCKDLFTLLGLHWNCRRVKNCATKKIRCPDRGRKNQEQKFILASDIDKFVFRSERTDKVFWVREQFMGIKTKRVPEEKEKQKNQRKTQPAPTRTTPSWTFSSASPTSTTTSPSPRRSRSTSVSCSPTSSPRYAHPGATVSTRSTWTRRPLSCS